MSPILGREIAQFAPLAPELSRLTATGELFRQMLQLLGGDPLLVLRFL